MQLKTIEISKLRPHPMNSNRMPKEYLVKLANHIERTGQYPPVIIRPLDDDHYQILDGHHRVKALQKLTRNTAQCIIWDVDDDQALLLLATLNRLQGSDDPHARAALVEQLTGRYSIDQLPALLPEQHDALHRLLTLNHPPEPQPQRTMQDLPVAVHFFLSRPDARKLEQILKQHGGTREQALMAIAQQP